MYILHHNSFIISFIYLILWFDLLDIVILHRNISHLMTEPNSSVILSITLNHIKISWLWSSFHLFFSSYHLALFCSSTEILLHKIGSHCPLCSLEKKKVTKITLSVHHVYFLEQERECLKCETEELVSCWKELFSQLQ